MSKVTWKSLHDCLKEAGGKLPIRVRWECALRITNLPIRITITKIDGAHFRIKELPRVKWSSSQQLAQDDDWYGATTCNWALIEDRDIPDIEHHDLDSLHMGECTEQTCPKGHFGIHEPGCKFKTGAAEKRLIEDFYSGGSYGRK